MACTRAEQYCTGTYDDHLSAGHGTGGQFNGVQSVPRFLCLALSILLVEDDLPLEPGIQKVDNEEINRCIFLCSFHLDLMPPLCRSPSVPLKVKTHLVFSFSSSLNP